MASEQHEIDDPTYNGFLSLLKWGTIISILIVLLVILLITG